MSKSCSGVSAKSQVLFALVWTSRYFGLITEFAFDYVTVMKVAFIVASYTAVFMTVILYRDTNDSRGGRNNSDAFLVEPLLIGCVFMATFAGCHLSVFQTIWTFSILLEVTAGLPQFYMLSKTGPPGSIVRDYLFGITAYRTLYVCDWAYQFFTIDTYVLDPIAFTAGCVQASLFYSYLCTAYFHNTTTTSITWTTTTKNGEEGESKRAYDDDMNAFVGPTSYFHHLVEKLADILYYWIDHKHFALDELHKELKKRGLNVTNNELKRAGFKNFKMLIEDQPWLVLFENEGRWYVRRRWSGEARIARPLVDANRRMIHDNDNDVQKRKVEMMDDNENFVDPYDWL